MVNGENHSMSILVSSTTFDSSFTNQRLKETEGDPPAEDRSETC